MNFSVYLDMPDFLLQDMPDLGMHLSPQKSGISHECNKIIEVVKNNQTCQICAPRKHTHKSSIYTRI